MKILLLIFLLATPAEPVAKFEDYDLVLKRYSKDVLSDDFWKDKMVTHNVTKEEKKISEFKQLDQHMFMFVYSIRFSYEMALYSQLWEAEIKLFDDPVHQALLKKSEFKLPKKEDVEKYKNQLEDLRKKFAVKQEKFVEFMIKENKISQKEGDFLLLNVRNYNDKYKLIERK